MGGVRPYLGMPCGLVELKKRIAVGAMEPIELKKRIAVGAMEIKKAPAERARASWEVKMTTT